MSYNTRRSNTGYGPPQNQSAASVGQRRPVVTNNFVSGGQLPQQKTPGTPQQQPPRPQQQQPGINFRNQGQQPQQQGYQSQGYSNQQQQQARYQQGQATPVKQEQKPAVPVQQQPKPVAQQQDPPKPVVQQPAAPAVVPGANPPPPEDDVMDTNEDGTEKKKFWIKRKGVKLPKSEKVRRRNLILSKILQPKNAVMILNELVKGCVYNVEELKVKVDHNQFRGTVTFDGQEFAGTGRNKIAAKNAAAETALKHLVKNKQLTKIKKPDENGEEQMDIGEEEGGQVMPWSHIASFAMYKLFSTWGEDPNLVNKVGIQDIVGGSGNKAAGPHDPNPAKKMPENPETMNPLMLMHQMLPTAIWEEVGKSGTPPNVVFTFNVTVEDKHFSGTGSSKKAAKKLAAFAACHEIFNINYPPEVWTPMY